MAHQAYPLERLFGRILTPFEQFLRRTTAGGIVLMASALLALVVASTPAGPAFAHFWENRLGVSMPAHFGLDLSLHQWINDGLMALFFLLVGLEIKRETLVGELASLKDAALPVFAAVGGMAVPALIYAAYNAGTMTTHGWGIPMATDIAFAIGILVLLAARVPRNLIVFLTALAIADDIGAVLVIALFYTAEIHLPALAAAVGCLAALVLFNRGGIRHPLPYAITGVMLWLAVHESGMHATLAGIVLAFTIPARPAHAPALFQDRIEELQAAFVADRLDRDTPDDPLSNHRMASIAEAMERSARLVQSPLQRIEHRLAPWVGFVVIPLFALSNAGIDLFAIAWSEAWSSRVTLGIVSGLVIGKFVGISAFSWLAVRLRLARLPAGVTWSHVLGAAWLGGIGFTMSLFIAQLAFASVDIVAQAKLGIILASVISAVLGLAWLLLIAPHAEEQRS